MVEFRALRFNFRVGIFRKSSVCYVSNNLRGTVANKLVVTMHFPPPARDEGASGCTSQD